jgi:hypothetical protein
VGVVVGTTLAAELSLALNNARVGALATPAAIRHTPTEAIVGTRGLPRTKLVGSRCRSRASSALDELVMPLVVYVEERLVVLSGGDRRRLDALRSALVAALRANAPPQPRGPGAP